MPAHASATKTPESTVTEPGPRGLTLYADLALAALLALAGAGAAVWLPDGDPSRLVLVLPVLLLVPGYLLMQATAVPIRSNRSRVTEALVAIGLSPALVGLLALASVLLPGGLTAEGAVWVVTTFCLLLTLLAGRRRWNAARRSADPHPSPVPETPKAQWSAGIPNRNPGSTHPLLGRRHS